LSLICIVGGASGAAKRLVRLNNQILISNFVVTLALASLRECETHTDKDTADVVYFKNRNPHWDAQSIYVVLRGLLTERQFTKFGIGERPELEVC